MSTDATQYNLTKTLLISTIDKYDDYENRTALLSFTSMLAKIQTAYDEAVASGLTQFFLDKQVILLTSYVEEIENLIFFEQELGVIPESEEFYFTGTFSPTTQDTAVSYTIQSHDLVKEVPSIASSSLESTNIASTARNIATFTSPANYFVTSSLVIRKGVWLAFLQATTTSVASPYPIVYMELLEVAADGTTQIGDAIATGTSTYGTEINYNGEHKVFLSVPAYTLASTTSRLKLLLWAVNSDASATVVALTIKNNTSTQSKIRTTLPEPIIYYEGTPGPTGAIGQTGPTGAVGPVGPGKYLNVICDMPATMSSLLVTSSYKTFDTMFSIFTPTTTSVLIEFSFFLTTVSTNQHVTVGLSGGPSEFIYSSWVTAYSASTSTTTVDVIPQQDTGSYREYITMCWYLTGLSANTPYNLCPSIKLSTGTGTVNVLWGGTAGGTCYPPLALKITQLDNSWGTGGGNGVTP